MECQNQNIPNEKGIAQWTDDKGFAEGGRGCATGNKDAGDAILPAGPRHTKEIPVTEMWPVFFCMDTKQKKRPRKERGCLPGSFFFQSRWQFREHGYNKYGITEGCHFAPPSALTCCYKKE